MTVAGEGARRRRAEDRLIYILGRRVGGRAARLSDPRPVFESHPQNAVLKAVMDLVGGDGRAFDAIELYSCFPCVPKMARRTLGLGPTCSRR
jgi:acetyl-CoA C-acetyltransferase